MLIVGLVFIAAAAVAAVELILANHGKIDLHMWRWTWQIDAFWLVVAGAAILLVAFLGLLMLKSSGRRARRARRERKSLTAENRRLATRADVAEATSGAPAVPSAPMQARSAGPTAPAPTAATWPAPAGGVAPTGQHERQD